VTALQVVASACDEPDYGLDTNLWSDSPGEWGKQYGFGPLPFGKSGNPDSDGVSQLPFHTGFFHEGSLTYQSEPLFQKTLALWRVHQYEGLSMLAWRTGHAYWGWRFAGMALHYVQDLTQPYHASAAPGTSTLRLTAINLLAMAGLPSQKDELAVLQSNRRQALEKYQTQLLHQASVKHQDTALVQALRTPRQDASYPPWSEHYARDVVAAEARAHAATVAEALLATLPARLVADPAFDFGQQEAQLDLLAELNRQAPARRARLDNTLAELMIHFATHSRNVLRGLLAAQP